MSNLRCWSRIFGSAMGSIIAFSARSVFAQIMPDVTLPTNSQVITQNSTTTITGGTRIGANLFHSFLNFSVPTNSTASFQNTAGIQNIISRVTGNSITNIDGILQVGGTANLFLINPNGIIFGSQAQLNIGGSFLASTASSINFADGQKFSATNPQSSSPLSVSIPIGLQFGATAALISNQSQASPHGAKNVINQPVGLQVQSGKTLALVGGDLLFDGGNVTAKSGSVELGSVAPNNLVTINHVNQGWVLGYENVNNFQNIKLVQRTFGGTEVGSIVDTSGVDGGGRIVVQGNIVKLISHRTILTSQTLGIRNGQDLTINAKKLILQDGAQVRVSTFNQGNGGNLNVNTSDSVELMGGIVEPVTNSFISSALVSDTAGDGHAGNITVNTSRLRLQNGAEISADSGGNLNPSNLILIPARGNGGNITINASESVEVTGILAVGFPSNLSATTIGTGAAGRVTVNTEKLLVRDGGIAVTSRIPRLAPPIRYQGNVNELGTAGEIIVNARFILLDNQGQITSNSQGGGGGDITLRVQDVLLLRRSSQISTNAGTANAPGNGGNITINAPNGFLVATLQGNNDITANAFSGTGGRILINTNGLFGFVQRNRADLVSLLGTEDPAQLNPRKVPTSDITAFSQQNPTLSGIIQINTPDIDPSKGLELPTEPIDASRQIATGCKPGGKLRRGSLIATGKGGIAPSPTEPLMDDTVLGNWITLDDKSESSTGHQPQQFNFPKLHSINRETQIMPAQGWVMDGKGNVTLLAQAPTVTPHSSLLNSGSCAAVR